MNTVDTSAVDGGPPADPAAALAAWRERHPAADAVTLAIAEGLARRAARQPAPARAWLLQRLERLQAPATGPAAERTAAAEPAGGAGARADGLPASTSADAAPPPAPVAGDLATLARLVDRLGRHEAAPAPWAAMGPAATASATRSAAAPSPPPLSTLSRAVPPRPLKSIARFGPTWSRLRADQRLRQALSQVPDRPGPLNSAHVVNRALQVMRELSPAYLDAFMAHVDTLLSIEQSSGLGDLRAQAGAAAAEAKPTAAATGGGARTGSTPAGTAKGKGEHRGPGERKRRGRAGR